MMMLTVLLLLTLAGTQSVEADLRILNAEAVDNMEETVVVEGGRLRDIYNDTVFNEPLNCRNGDLQIVNNTYANSLVLEYSGPPLDPAKAHISISPNDYPLPSVETLNQTALKLSFNCPADPTNQDYYNKVTVSLSEDLSFSFLLHCDPKNRHKKFEYGYLLLSLLDAAILVGVAMHSHVWSLTPGGKPLRLELKWLPFTLFSVGVVGLLFGLYFFAAKNFSTAFLTVRYFGIGVSVFFVFLCCNEILYLIKPLRQVVKGPIRICEVASVALTLLLTVLACFFESWILYDVLGTCICVGAIKIFHFNSLRQAFRAMLIMVGTVTTVAIILHFILPRSYNDYASELSSPLFLQVPDLVENLYKECSWLPVLDVIVPGVTLSYLRLYDQNRSSRWGGVYTVSGNIAFVFSTALWIGIQALYPFSVPFSLVTYLSLMAVIFIIGWRRNDWTTLYYGRFEMGFDQLSAAIVEENRASFSRLLPKEVVDEVMRHSKEQSGASIIY